MKVIIMTSDKMSMPDKEVKIYQKIVAVVPDDYSGMEYMRDEVLEHGYVVEILDFSEWDGYI